MNPDENLMYSKACYYKDYWSCPEILAEGALCGRCGMTSHDQRRKDLAKSPAEQAVLGAQIANILTAADRGEDMVNLPPHYARFKIEPMHFIVENGLNWFQGNVLKYILRYDAKNGLEDLRKAQRYLTMFIKWVEGDVDWWKKEAA